MTVYISTSEKRLLIKLMLLIIRYMRKRDETGQHLVREKREHNLLVPAKLEARQYVSAQNRDNEDDDGGCNGHEQAVADINMELRYFENMYIISAFVNKCK